MGKLAILGGTFNPVHLGHLLIAEAALDQYQLDGVVWVPTYHPPHRVASELIDVSHRVNMVHLAIHSNAAFTLSTVELNRNGTSYAIDTLDELKQIYPSSQWYWIIGLDAFQSLPHWYRRQELVAQCIWLIAPRWLGKNDNEQNAGQHDDVKLQFVVQQLAAQAIEVCWMPLIMPRVEISSSLIRQHCSDRRSIRYMVPDAVLSYIATHNLYH
jgi:nicotinate-nucleotide adenylyltransferase